MSVSMKYFQKMADKKIDVKVFIEGSSPTQSKTMLSGRINGFDEESIVLDECLIYLDRVISVAPMR